VLREGEPLLPELLKHPRVVILGEPGAGKSLVARAAVREFASDAQQVSIFAELKTYRGDLSQLLASVAPALLVDTATTANGKPLQRAYVLDGVDEIPRELIDQFGKDLAALLTRDPSAAAASVILPEPSAIAMELCVEPFPLSRLNSSRAKRCLRLRCASRASVPASIQEPLWLM
jgi:hypothetical protein